jgi:hypothetical protein
LAAINRVACLRTVTIHIVVASEARTGNAANGTITDFHAIADISIVATQGRAAHTALKDVACLLTVTRIGIVAGKRYTLNAAQLSVANLQAIAHVTVVAVHDRPIATNARKAGFVARARAIIVAGSTVQFWL